MSKKEDFESGKMNMDSKTFEELVNYVKKTGIENLSGIERILEDSSNRLRVFGNKNFNNENIEESNKKFKLAYEKLEKAFKEYKEVYDSHLETIKKHYLDLIKEYEKTFGN
jgi:hypothetical protein